MHKICFPVCNIEDENSGIMKIFKPAAFRAAILCILFSAITVKAQVTVQESLNQLPEGKLTLEAAIGIALKNNPQLKQAGLQYEMSVNEFEQAQWRRWPSLNFSAAQGFSFGRNIDPFTNQFVQQNVAFNNYNLSAGVTLFNGGALQNSVKQTQITKNAAEKDLDAARNDVMLNVALAYLQILNNIELITVAERQIEATQYQLERTTKLVEAGSLAESNLFDLRSQLANDELTLVNAQNNLENAKLTIKQLMNVIGGQPVEVAEIAVADPTLQLYDASLEEVFNSAVSNLPQMKAAEFKIQAAQKGIDVARSAYLPSLTLSAGLGTSFSSAAPKERFIGDGSGTSTVEVPSATQFVMVGDVLMPIYNRVTTINGANQHFGYFDQLNFNRNPSINLSLRVPIFNGFQARYQVNSAKINYRNNKYQGELALQQIRQNVEQAYISMTNAAKKYSATANQVRALEETFRVAESRFNVGAINSTEYNIAKANLDQSRANLVQAKYDYVFRTKILDFYMARPLSID
jgi:outer membrane protein